MSASTAPASGTLVDDRYRLTAMLGEGSFGGVWRAEDGRLSRRSVAVKFLKPEFLSQPDLVARFDSEADALAQVQHPNVVSVIDRGQWAGQRFIVTEFVEGKPLTAWIRSHKDRAIRSDQWMTLSLFDQICAGIEAAHGVRAPGPIVHRDIKPDNVLVRVLSSGEHVVKVVDFGIAQLGRRSGTQSGMLMGTPQYMSPEQAFGQSAGIGPWTDVFSLAVVLIEMLTLKAQPNAEEPWWGAALRRPTSEIKATLTALRDDVSPQVWDVVLRCLATHAGDRPQDAGALRAALRPYVPTASMLPAYVPTPVPTAPGPRESTPMALLATVNNGPAQAAPSVTQASEVEARARVVESALQPVAAPISEPFAASVDSQLEPRKRTPWVLVMVLVALGAVALSALLVTLVVWSDQRHTPTHETPR